MDVETFQVSAETIKKKKRERYFYALIFPIYAIAIALFTPMALYGLYFIGFMLGMGLLVMFVSILLIPHTVIKKLTALKVILGENGIEYISHKNSVSIAYQDITKLRITQTKSNEIIYFQVFTESKSAFIHSVDNLNRLSISILRHAPSTVKVQRNTARFNPNKPTSIILTSVIVLILLLVFFQFAVLSSVSSIGSSLLYICLGLYSILFTPSFKTQNAENRQLDRVIGIIILVLGLALFGFKVSTYGTAVLGNSPCGWIGKYVHDSGCIQSFDKGETVAFLPDNKTLAHDIFSAIPFSSLSGWDGFWTPVLKHQGNLQSFVLSEDGYILLSWTWLSVDSQKFLVWDTRDQHLINTQIIPTKNIYNANLAITSDGQVTAFADTPPEGPIVEIWQTQPWQKLLTIDGYGPLAFSPDDQYLTGKKDGSQIVMWDATTGHEIMAMEMPESYHANIKVVAFSPDGQQLAGLDSGGVIYLWQTTDGKLNQVMEGGGSSSTDQLVYSPDGLWLVSGYQTRDTDQNYLTIWNMQTAQLQNEILLGEGYRFDPKSFSFTSDGQLLAVGMNDGVFVFEFEKLLQ